MKRIFTILFLLSLIIFFGITGYLFINRKNQAGLTKIISPFTDFLSDRFNPASIELKGTDDHMTTILFLGTPGVPNPAPNLTDSIILFIIKDSPTGLTTKLISLPRDLITYDPLVRDYVKINALYSLHNALGIAQLRESIQAITGVAVDYFTLIDLSVVKEVVDALGGINVWIEEPINDPRFPTDDLGVEDFNIPRGWRFLDGETALKFVRTRHSKGGDFARMQRQQTLLLALFKKFQNNEIKDPRAITQLYSVVSKKILTDISLLEGAKFYTLFTKLKKEDIMKSYLNLENSLVEKKRTVYGGVQDVLEPHSGKDDYTSVQQTVNTFLRE